MIKDIIKWLQIVPDFTNFGNHQILLQVGIVQQIANPFVFFFNLIFPEQATAEHWHTSISEPPTLCANSQPSIAQEKHLKRVGLPLQTDL